MESKRSEVGGLPNHDISIRKIQLSEIQQRILISGIIFIISVGLIVWILHSDSQLYVDSDRQILRIQLKFN